MIIVDIFFSSNRLDFEFTMISTIAIGGLAKRLVEEPPAYKLPDLAPVVFLADLILFLPVLVIVSLSPATPFSQTAH